MHDALAAGVERDARAVDDDAPDAADGAEPEVAPAELRPRRAVRSVTARRETSTPGDLRRDRAGARSEVVDLDRAFLCDVADHEAAYDDRGDRPAGDTAVGRRVPDDEKAGRSVVTLRARGRSRRQREDRGACKKEENPAHYLRQSTSAPRAGGTSGA